MGVEECHRSGGCPYPTDCVYWRKCRITDRPAASSPDEGAELRSDASERPRVVLLLGQRLRECRERAGLSQAKLGSLLGVNQATVSGWESGRRQPSIADLGQAADALGVPVGSLFTPAASGKGTGLSHSCMNPSACVICLRAASSPDEPQYVGACQVTSTSGVCVLGTAGCITRHIVEAMRSASSPGEASDDRHRNTWDGSCSLCGMGNEYVDQHAPDCPASADEGAPEGCEIDPVSSRGCERGTPGCVTQHADEGARQRPDTAELRLIADDLSCTLGLRDANRVRVAADWIDAQPPVPPSPAPQADRADLIDEATGP